MISRLAERIVRVIPEHENEKKKQYLETIAQDKLTTTFCAVENFF
jgi:hypothetical protein